MKNAWRLNRNAKGLAFQIQYEVTKRGVLVVQPEGSGTLNLLVETVAKLQESFGHSLVIIPEFATEPSPFSLGTREVLHLAVRKREGHRDAG